MPVPNFTLSNGVKIPAFGFGTYKLDNTEAFSAVKTALDNGYRHIDTAAYYENEVETAKAIKAWLDEDSSRKREDVFYTTKLQNKDGLFTDENVEKRVKLVEPFIGHVDLLLIHNPGPTKESRLDAWKKFQTYFLEHPGKIRALGVSNYSIGHLKELLAYEDLKVKPVVNQIELNPWLTRKELVDFLKENDILAEAWGPLTRGIRVEDSEVAALAKKYNKTQAQILLNWSYLKGFLPLAKSSNPQRIKENLDSFNFSLSKEDIESLTHDDSYYLSDGFDPIKDVPV